MPLIEQPFLLLLGAGQEILSPIHRKNSPRRMELSHSIRNSLQHLVVGEGAIAHPPLAQARPPAMAGVAVRGNDVALIGGRIARSSVNWGLSIP
jgi:hypothetical protein